MAITLLPKLFFTTQKNTIAKRSNSIIALTQTLCDWKFDFYIELYFLRRLNIAQHLFVWKNKQKKIFLYIYFCCKLPPCFVLIQQNPLLKSITDTQYQFVFWVVTGWFQYGGQLTYGGLHTELSKNKVYK